MPEEGLDLSGVGSALAERVPKVWRQRWERSPGIPTSAPTARLSM